MGVSTHHSQKSLQRTRERPYLPTAEFLCHIAHWKALSRQLKNTEQKEVKSNWISSLYRDESADEYHRERNSIPSEGTQQFLCSGCSLFVDSVTSLTKLNLPCLTGRVLMWLTQEDSLSRHIFLSTHREVLEGAFLFFVLQVGQQGKIVRRCCIKMKNSCYFFYS